LFKGSRVQRFKGSKFKVQRFKAQRFKGLKVQGFKGSRFFFFDNPSVPLFCRFVEKPFSLKIAFDLLLLAI
jgi:hypothetical protein